MSSTNTNAFRFNLTDIFGSGGSITIQFPTQPELPLDGPQPTPATESDIKTLQEHPYQKLGVNDEQCSICLSSLQEGEQTIRLQSCKHVYHANCLKQWLSHGNQCPVCRDPIGTDAHKAHNAQTAPAPIHITNTMREDSHGEEEQMNIHVGPSSTPMMIIHRNIPASVGSSSLSSSSTEHEHTSNESSSSANPLNTDTTIRELDVGMIYNMIRFT